MKNNLYCYYLGPAGTFSGILAQRLFTKEVIQSVDTFERIVEKVQSQKDAIGLLALENSITSSVHKTVDLLYRHHVYIVGEVMMQIDLHLIGKKGSHLDDITDVYSHPQALAQCSSFLHTHSMRAHESVSTTSDRLSLTSQSALIGSNSVSKHDSDLQILASNIANDHINLTRWVLVSRRQQSLFGPVDKMTYIVQVPHVPGSLAKLLNCIAAKGGNLTKIESRPLPGTVWEYAFWIDLEVPVGIEQEINDMMNKYTQLPRLVGAYRRGKTITI